MIDLQVLITEDFRYSPLLNCTKTETLISKVAGTKEVETFRRTVDPADFTAIEEFGEDLIKKHHKEGVHFDYDITLAALALILVERDEEFPDNFLGELSKLNAEKEAPELFWCRKVASELLRIKERSAGKVREKVRKHFPEAVFLPVEEMGLIFDPPPHLAKAKIEQQLMVAACYKDKVIKIIDHEGTVFDLPEEAVLASHKDADVKNIYLTDYGQTLGFGKYGTLELENDWVFAQAKATA